MERRKTTVYLDPDVLTATKVLAVARSQSKSRVVEDALRAYLGKPLRQGRTEAGRQPLTVAGAVLSGRPGGAPKRPPSAWSVATGCAGA